MIQLLLYLSSHCFPTGPSSCGHPDFWLPCTEARLHPTLPLHMVHSLSQILLSLVSLLKYSMSKAFDYCYICQSLLLPLPPLRWPHEMQLFQFHCTIYISQIMYFLHPIVILCLSLASSKQNEILEGGRWLHSKGSYLEMFFSSCTGYISQKLAGYPYGSGSICGHFYMIVISEVAFFAQTVITPRIMSPIRYCTQFTLLSNAQQCIVASCTIASSIWLLTHLLLHSLAI